MCVIEVTDLYADLVHVSFIWRIAESGLMELRYKCQQ